MPDWTIKQSKYQLWLAAPRAARPKDLRSRQAVAKRLGVTTPTLRRWEVEPGWWDSVFAQARAIVGRELGSILRAMVIQARGGSVTAAKLCLEVLGVHHTKVQHEIDMRSDQLIVVLHPDALPPGQHPAQLPRSASQEIVDGVVIERLEATT